MKYTEIRYERTFNLGNFENEKIGVTSILEEGDDAGEALQEMISFVETKGRKEKKNPEVFIQKEEPKPIIKEEPKPIIKEEPKPIIKEEPKPIIEEEPIKKLEPVVETLVSKPIEEKPVEIVEENIPEPKKEPKKVSFKADATKKAPPPKANVKYSREIKAHRDELCALLNEFFPDWKSDPAKAKKVSENLEGIDFLDSENIVIYSFIEIFKAKMRE